LITSLLVHDVRGKVRSWQQNS